MSWYEAGFHVAGQKVLWTDLAGNICALATVWLATLRTVWTWPVQLSGSVLLFAASLNAHVTGNALKQVMFAVLAVYGWYRWTRGARRGGDLLVRPGTARERAALLAAMAVGTVAVALLLEHFHASWAPWPDAYIFAGSAAATFAQGRALIDFWWIWLAVDLVGVPLALMSGLWVTGAVYGVFLVLVLNGYRDWRRIWQARSVHTPRPEAVAN
ncbi:nicotinamide mononucleotide transporter [Actinomadura sp. NBRC 104425]|uniref:nicotinamide riboside transporter PnuC n=1 Tax=Actinomadura sp. NBRC 104425 TaxID=3032204 RepID=UPI0024A0CD22|nr:nicotinamide riboside transporter PnuC [Actinomadura sp. NBRC 104425]GLZ10546.1 nicotinamide mononucleotide transporter [Actinomadura sp. NBRC 104425]